MEPLPKTILIVDDEEPLLQALSLKLLSEEFQVITAPDGEVGLAMALTHHPHLILLDLLMPKMGGIAVLAKLREDEWGKSAKLIVLTNQGGDTTMLAEVLENNVTDYWIKTDHTLEDIVRKIKERLQQ